MDAPSAIQIRSRLLRWFDATKRDMPWRRTKDPYRILLAEYLLQRTRVVSGTPYYERFLERFPDLPTLAVASEEDVLRAWEGLGFYRRARNLHRAAKVVMELHGGRIPSNADALRELPGIGPYTAGAVASIAFGERVPAVDGNVLRVLARAYRIETDVAKGEGRDRVEALARRLVPPSRPGAFNQALMELGATVCTPKSPSCSVCPLEDVCLARGGGVEGRLPKLSPPRKPQVVPVAFALVESQGRVLLTRRPDHGLLAGLWSLPGGELPSAPPAASALEALVFAQAGVRARVGPPVARVAHTFSHRRWSGAIYRCEPEGMETAPRSRWATPEDARDLPLVPFHRKALVSVGFRPALESFDRPQG